MAKTYKLLSISIIFAIAAQIIIGGILLPVKQASAGLCSGSVIIDPIADAATYAYNAFIAGVKWAWDTAQAAFQKVVSGDMLKNIKLGNIIDDAKKLYDKAEPYVKKAAGISWNILRKNTLNMLVNNIVQWIQGGGKPKFVTDWNQFLRDTVNEAGGKFILSSPDLAFLCSSFGTELRIALGAVPPFKEQVTCTLDQVAANINDFYNDMRKGGGWDGWLKVSQGSNNVFGAYFDVQGEKMAREATAREAATNEAVAGSGFLGDKVCAGWECDENEKGLDADDCVGNLGEDPSRGKIDECYKSAGCECKRWETRTPGKILADTTSKALNVDIDGLINAKEFDEYTSAIFDAVINRATREGLAMMKTDTYVPSVSDNQIYNDMVKQLNDRQSLTDRMAAGKPYGQDDSINIANRQGQKTIMTQFRKTLILLKNKIKQAIKHLEPLKNDSNIMMECANFKYDMCEAHADEIAPARTESLCAAIKQECLSQNCVSGESSCEQEKIQKCNNELAQCRERAGEIFSIELRRDKCEGILDDRDMTLAFQESLNPQEQLRELSKVFTLLPFDANLTNTILQKLQNYKPFDECAEQLCSSLENAQECREMAWYNPAKKSSFINGDAGEGIIGKCGILPDEIKEKCALLKDENKISDCENEWTNECKAEWEQKTKSIVKENDSEKELFGVCFTRKVFVISDSYEDFTQNLEARTKAECGDIPAQECSAAIYNGINDPLNKCIKENTSSCMADTRKTDIQCYNDLTTPPDANSPSNYIGMCYQYLYKDLNYDTLVNEDSTKITDDDQKFISEVQESKHQEYSALEGTLSQNLLVMSKSGERCQDQSVIPDGSYNKYQTDNACVRNYMNKCAPLELTRRAYKAITGVRSDSGWDQSHIGFRFFTDYNNWESLWRGCLQCSRHGRCSDTCATWWTNKNSIDPFQIPTSQAMHMDIWNNTIEVPKYWSNTQWRYVFEISGEDMQTIKEAVKQEMEEPGSYSDNTLNSEQTNDPGQQEPQQQEPQTSVQSSCCD